MKALVAEALAVAVKVLTPSCDAGNAVMVSCWVAEVEPSPSAAAVMVGFPALVSP